MGNEAIKNTDISFGRLAWSVAKAGSIAGISNVLSFVSFGLIRMESIKRPLVREMKVNLIKYGIQVTKETQSEFLSKLKPKAVQENQQAFTDLAKATSELGESFTSLTDAIGLGGVRETAGEVLTDKATDFTITSFATFMRVNTKLGGNMLDDTMDKALINRGFKNYYLRYMAKGITGTMINLFIVETQAKTDLKSLALAGTAGIAMRAVNVKLKEREVAAKAGTPELALGVQKEVQEAEKEAEKAAKNNIEIIKERARPGRVTFLVVKVIIYGGLKAGSFCLKGVTLGLIRCDVLTNPLARSIQRDITGIVVHKFVDSLFFANNKTVELISGKEQAAVLKDFFDKYGIAELIGDVGSIQVENISPENLINWLQEVPAGDSEAAEVVSTLLPSLITGTLMKFFSTYMRVNKDIAWQQLESASDSIFGKRTTHFVLKSPARHLFKRLIKEHVIEAHYTNDGKFVAGAASARIFTTHILPTLEGRELPKYDTEAELVQETPPKPQKPPFSYWKATKDITAYTGIHILNNLIKLSSLGIFSMNSLQREYAREVRQNTLNFLAEGEISAFAYAPDAATGATEKLVERFTAGAEAGSMGALAQNLTEIGVEGLESFSLKGAGISIKLNASWSRIDDYVVKSLADRGVTSKLIVTPIRTMIQYLIGEYVVEPHIKDITKGWVAAALAERLAMSLNFFGAVKKVCTFASAAYGVAKIGLEGAIAGLSYILHDDNIVNVSPEDIEEALAETQTDKAVDQASRGYELGQEEDLLANKYSNITKDNFKAILETHLKVDTSVTRPEYIRRRMQITKMKSNGLINETELNAALDKLQANFKQAQKLKEFEALAGNITELSKSLGADVNSIQLKEISADDLSRKIRPQLDTINAKFEELHTRFTEETQRKDNGDITDEAYAPILASYEKTKVNLASLQTNFDQILKLKEFEALAGEISKLGEGLKAEDTSVQFNIETTFENSKQELEKTTAQFETINAKFGELNTQFAEETRKKEAGQITDAAYAPILAAYKKTKATHAKAETELNKIKEEHNKIATVYNKSKTELEALEKNLKFEVITQEKYDLQKGIIQTKAEYALRKINEARYNARIKRANDRLEALKIEDDIDLLGNIFNEDLLLPMGNERGMLSVHETLDKDGNVTGVTADGFSAAIEGEANEGHTGPKTKIANDHQEKLQEITDRQKATNYQIATDTQLGIDVVKVDPRFARQHKNIKVGFGKAGEVRKRFEDMDEICKNLQREIENPSLLYATSKFLNNTAAKKLASIIETEEHGFYKGEPNNTWIKSKDVYLRINKEEPSYTFDISRAPSGNVIVTINTSWEVTEVTKNLDSMFYTHKTSKKQGSLFTTSTLITLTPKPQEQGWLAWGLGGDMPVDVANIGFMNVAAINMHAEVHVAKAAETELA